MSVACFCDGSDAPLHVLSVELELCFGDVVVELLDGLGIVCALLVGGVLGGEVQRALAFRLVSRDVFAPFESAFAEAPSAFGGDDGDLVVGDDAIPGGRVSFGVSFFCGYMPGGYRTVQLQEKLERISISPQEQKVLILRVSDWST